MHGNELPWHPPFSWKKGRLEFKISAIISATSDFGNTNSFIKVKLYIHNIGTNLTVKYLVYFRATKLMLGSKSK